jgi:OmpA family/Bacterial Ig domain
MMRTRIAALALVAFAAPAMAQDEAAPEGKVLREDVATWTLDVDGVEYEARPGTPTYRGDTGLFHLSSAYTLPKGKVSVSFFRDNIDRDPKDIDLSTHGLTFAVGASSKLELFASVGVQNRLDVDARDQDGFFNDLPFAGLSSSSPGWQTGFGDVWVGGKLKLLDDYRGDGVGLAVRGQVKLPTADEEKGLGTGKVGVAGDLILSKRLGYGADLHANLGFETLSADDVSLGNAFNWGVGLNVPALEIVQLQAELMGRSYGDADFSQTNPVDLVVGPVIYIKGVFIRPAISWNVNFDDRGLGSSSQSYTGRQISIGYHPGTPAREIYVPPPPPPPPQNRPPTVACRPDKSSIEPGSSVTCTATASDPDGDELSYEWSASAGTVTGSGATATLDSNGVAPNSDVRITVKVSDGRGGNASADCHVKVESAPEPYTCVSGGFPSNRGRADNRVAARLNNVDKACLDDVATRLRQDSRSRVLVVGHADSTETNPEVVSRVRAENVKAYLVDERGVEESRVSVRGAGAGRPLDEGTSKDALAKNRRVEVIFLPAGATPPEFN